MAVNYFEFLRAANQKILKDMQNDFQKSLDSFEAHYLKAMSEIEGDVDGFLEALKLETSADKPPATSEPGAEGEEKK